MKRFLFVCVAFIVATLFFSSCQEKIPEPSDLLSDLMSGEWVELDEQSECDEYIVFDKGMLSINRSKQKHQVADNQIWHTDGSDYDCAYYHEYSVRDNYLVCNPRYFQGKISVDGELLMIADRKYCKLDSFNPEYYNHILVPEESLSYEMGYEASQQSIPFEIEHPFSWYELSATSSSKWISNIKVADGKVDFDVDLSYEDREATLTLSYPHAGPVVITISQSSRRRIVLSKTELHYDRTARVCDFTYTIDNPKEGGQLAATTSATWIKDLTVSTDRVEFAVDENNEGHNRTADVLLKYPEAKDIIVKVEQTDVSPVILLTPTTQNTDYKGGDYEVSWTVENPIKGEEVTVSSVSEWIGNLRVVGNKVSYTVAENSSGSSREGIIEFGYAGQTERFSIMQSYPRIVLSSDSQKIDYRAGSFNITYTVEGPHVGDNLEASSSSPWITGVTVSGNKVTYTVTENYGRSSREGIIELKYAGCHLQFVVSQSPDFDFPLTFFVKGAPLKMIGVEGGVFVMGMFPRPYQVTLSDYYIGQTEVTQELWETVMGSNPSYHTGNLKYPVEQVSWNDIVNDFLPKLNALTGMTFTLPTEAQWTFAARGGNKSQGYMYSGSNNLDDVAWYDGNSSRETHPVGKKLPNELGIYDMSGNVSEWCSDWYGPCRPGEKIDPQGPESGSYRITRGGNYRDRDEHCTSSFRDYRHYPYRINDGLGFRLVLNM